MLSVAASLGGGGGGKACGALGGRGTTSYKLTRHAPLFLMVASIGGCVGVGAKRVLEAWLVLKLV